MTAADYTEMSSPASAPAVTITSFGYLHGPPPAAHLTIDVRHHFRDPHARPELRELDAADARVRAAVAQTPGAGDLALSAGGMVAAFRAGPTAGQVYVAIGGAGGRHRAPAIAMAMSRALAGQGVPSLVEHRDMARPVVDRGGPRVIRAAVPVVQADMPAAGHVVDGPGWDEAAARAFGEWADANDTIAGYGSGTSYAIDDLEAAFAAGWAARGLTFMCPGGCGCRVGTLDADARECGCDGPCTDGDGGAARADCVCGWTASGDDSGQLSTEVVAHLLTHRPGGQA